MIKHIRSKIELITMIKLAELKKKKYHRNLSEDFVLKYFIERK